MCLTVCRQRDLVYDSDRTLVCKECPLYQKTDPNQSCLNCKHYYKDAQGKELCLLTQMAIPSTRWCCHHNSKARLSYYSGPLDKVDGIVLVEAGQFEEACNDYLKDHPLLGELQPVEDLDSLLEAFDFDEPLLEDDLFDLEAIQIKLSENLLSDLFEPSEESYRVVEEGERHKGVYVPIVVGEKLVRYHKGVEGVVLWFEKIYGGKEDILKDWKGRWIVKPIRFATPAVYGVDSPSWGKLVSEDISDLIHAYFS